MRILYWSMEVSTNLVFLLGIKPYQTEWGLSIRLLIALIHLFIYWLKIVQYAMVT